jgi:hypothetical protein
MPKLLKVRRWFLRTFNTDHRSKPAHEPLVKALYSFENMVNHGEPIKLVVHQLIT